MGTAGAKAFGDVLRVNKTLQHLNVSNNSFGKMQEGDQVKLRSSGEVCTISAGFWNNGRGLRVYLSSGKESHNITVDDIEWVSHVPDLCAGLAASASLLSVSDSMWCNAMMRWPCDSAGG